MKYCIVCGGKILPGERRASTELGDVCVRDAPDFQRVMVLGVEFIVELWTSDTLTRIRETSARWEAESPSVHADHGGFSPQSATWHCYDCGIYDHPHS